MFKWLLFSLQIYFPNVLAIAEYPVYFIIISLTYRYTVHKKWLVEKTQTLCRQDWFLDFSSITDLEGMKQISIIWAFCFINYKWDECCLLPAVHGVIKTSEK